MASLHREKGNHLSWNTISLISLPTSVLHELLEGRLPDGFLSPEPRTVAGRVGAHETIFATRVSLANSILCSADNTLHCTSGHLVVNAI